MKPSNIIVTDTGDRVKVLDFGLAKLFDPADRAAEARTQTTPLTEAGMVVGTAAYMSPEQAEGREVDARSDIFSFGNLLYEMVTGHRPFAGESNLAVLAKILNEDPTRPSALAPLGFAGCGARDPALPAKDPARRYQTMADLKVALEDLATDSAAGLTAQTPAAHASRRWRWALAASVPIVIVIAYAVGGRHHHRKKAWHRCGPFRSRRCPA